jgi:hypothetical protein
VTPLSLGIFASANTTVGTSFESIATSTVGSGGSSYVEFTSIPGTYTHLQIRFLAKSASPANATDELYCQYNSDTGSNYTYHQLNGNGSTATSGAATSQTKARIAQIALTDNSTFSVGVVDILDYANTNKNKVTRGLSGADFNGSGVIVLQSTAWLNTSAITSIKLSSLLNFAQYSHFALYGIKSA